MTVNATVNLIQLISLMGIGAWSACQLKKELDNIKNEKKTAIQPIKKVKKTTKNPIIKCIKYLKVNSVDEYRQKIKELVLAKHPDKNQGQSSDIVNFIIECNKYARTEIIEKLTAAFKKRTQINPKQGKQASSKQPPLQLTNVPIMSSHH